MCMSICIRFFVVRTVLRRGRIHTCLWNSLWLLPMLGCMHFYMCGSVQLCIYIRIGFLKPRAAAIWLRTCMGVCMYVHMSRYWRIETLLRCVFVCICTEVLALIGTRVHKRSFFESRICSSSYARACGNVCSFEMFPSGHINRILYVYSGGVYYDIHPLTNT